MGIDIVLVVAIIGCIAALSALVYTLRKNSGKLPAQPAGGRCGGHYIWFSGHHVRFNGEFDGGLRR